MTLGKKIQFLRNKKDWSQKELADKLGIAPGTIQQYEADKREPKLEMINKIAKVFNVQVSILVDNNKKLIQHPFFRDSIPDVYCQFCHMTYTPTNKYQVKEHREFHKKYQKAYEKFGEFLGPKENKEVLEKYRKILWSNQSTDDELYEAVIKVFEAMFSESLYSSGLDINHIDFYTFGKYELRKPYYSDRLPENVYDRVQDKFKDAPLQEHQFYPVCCHKEEIYEDSLDKEQQKYFKLYYSQLNYSGKNKVLDFMELLTKIPDCLTQEEIDFRNLDIHE